MQRIAICEDEINYQTTIKNLLNTFAKAQELSFSIKEYHNVSQLLDEADAIEPYDLYFLDIYLPDGLGIDIAKKLREKNIGSPIIFITTSREHALESYSVRALQYLLKPIEENAFFSAMEMAIERETQEKSKAIILKYNGQFRSIATKDIVYTESYGHNQNIHLSNHQIISVRMSVSELFAKLIPAKKFARCGSSYILNLENIKNLHSKMITMTNGKTISIPRGAYADLKTQYFDYFSER